MRGVVFTGYTIVTNNKKILDTYSNSIAVDGGFLDVLYKVRDMVYDGHSLVSYPLFASIRMMYSPVRSVLVSDEKGDLDRNSLEVIENSIDKYIVTMGERKEDLRNKNDYEIIDGDLIISAMEEIKFISGAVNL